MGVRSCFGFATTTMLAFFIAPPALAQAASRDVVVHLDAKPNVTLEREDGDDNWVEVCFAPCDMPFSTREHYRVGGGIRDSEPFTLHETSPGLAVIVVEPRSRGVHALGDVLIGIGSAMTFVGGIAILVGVSVTQQCGSCGGNEAVPIGAVAVFFGVVGLIVGIDLVVVNNASHVHPESRADAHDDVNHVQTMLLDLSPRRENSWAAPSIGGAVPIFSYRF